MIQDREPDFHMCTIMQLPPEQWMEAARAAQQENPDNVPEGTILERLPEKDHRLALDISKYWGNQGVTLTVGFLDNPPADLRARLISHMNAWNKTANVLFKETSSVQDAKVRISRGSGGYWSYLGTDIMCVPAAKQTMNLDGFTMNTPDSEFHRVVRHETGHTLGFPHEHMRKQIIARLDRNKTIAYMQRTQGWTQQQVIDQVLTPLEEKSLLGTPEADDLSIMCYSLPPELTIDGKQVYGGSDINDSDYAFAGAMYPKPNL